MVGQVRRAIRLPALWLVLALVLAGCTDIGADPTVQPTTPPLGTSLAPTNPPTPFSTPPPTPAPWPPGWDDEFCAAFVELVVLTELVVDIPRAMEEEATGDALALARELRVSAAEATELITSVPSWERAEEAVTQMTRVADFGGRIARQFVRYLDEGRRPALNRARELIEELRPIVEETNSQLSPLADLGLACPPYGLSLEVP